MLNRAADFIEKPFQAAALVERVRQSFRQVEARSIAPSDRGLAARLKSLSLREREALDRMVTGATSKRIAHVLGGSFRTIETHRARELEKMKADSLAELVRMTLAPRSEPMAPPQPPHFRE